jgi:hypothetical protein
MDAVNGEGITLRGTPYSCFTARINATLAFRMSAVAVKQAIGLQLYNRYLLTQDEREVLNNRS